MSTLDVLTAIQNSAVAHAISKTNHLVGAGLQIIHVMGLILFLASLVLISLRLLGWVFAQQSVPQIAAEASRLMWVGLGLTALSGTLIFIATPKLYFYNWAFGLKMLLVVFAVIVQAALFRKVANSDSSNPAFAKTSVVLSLTCWFAVAFAGRMIGFV
jgi:hypothetical protein